MPHYWTEVGKAWLLGKTIVDFRYVESQGQLYPEFVLDDGTSVSPIRDTGGNGPGCFFMEELAEDARTTPTDYEILTPLQPS